jgi:pimeloyl-ACP methyl ester carboxylesterase
VADAPDEALCGKYEVFEDRAARSGRRIRLNVIVLPALGSKRLADPIFVFVGGPGLGAATTLSRGWLTDSVRADRDLVFVDQRGTGASNRFLCSFGSGVQAGFSELFPPEKVRACREALEPQVDLRMYTTSIAMDDLDEVRVALGYERINLYGISYGAQAALQYLRQHGKRVRSATLKGVATPAAQQPLGFAVAAEHAMRALIRDCAADAVCHQAFPNFAADFATLLATLDKGPVTFELENAATKKTERVSMSRGVFVERLRLLLYDLESTSRVPLILTMAARGDWVPFAMAGRAGVTGGVTAMYLTVTCSETMARIREADIVRESRDTFVGEYRTRTHMAACREWPRADVPAGYYEPVVSDVPVLMLSGELDAATPPKLGADALRTLKNGRQILIPVASHGYGQPCTHRLVTAFIAAGSARDLDASCVREIKRPVFVTALMRPR